MHDAAGTSTDPDEAAEALREAISLHLLRHLGDAQPAFIDAEAWAGRSKEPGPPVDVLVCPPEGERRFAYVASSGCSLKPLVGGEAVSAQRVEFVLAAPQRGEEDADRAMLNLAANTVRQFAKLVHLQPVSVEIGHTVAFSHDPQPVFEGSNQVAFAFLSPRLPADGFEVMQEDDRAAVRFFAPAPIDRDEFEAAGRKGPLLLADALISGGVTEMLDLARPSVAAADRRLRRGWLSRIARLFGRR